MNRSKRSFAISLTLIILLAAGPLQAQTIYVCGMTEKVMHDKCCCDHMDCIKFDDTDPSNAINSTCFTQSVQLAFDIDAPQFVFAGKHKVECRSNVDPPPAVDSLVKHCGLPREGSLPYAYPLASHSEFSHSDFYLTTRRLRI